MRYPFVKSGLGLLPFLLFSGACAGPTEKAQSVQRVDDLLAYIERVQVDSVVSKEMARAAFDQLDVLCSPSFAGEAKDAYAQLLERIENSEKQARTFRASIEPMRMSAESVFRTWTADLERFGNTRMRQRSQMRLDETQARYRSVYATAQSALISYLAFNGDLRDHALFLSHDMNAASVGELAGDVKLMGDVLTELDGRMDACANSARAYVESTVLYGQVESENPQAAPEEQESGTPANETTGSKRGTSTLKRRFNSPPATPASGTPTPAPASQGPIGPPTPSPTPPPQTGDGETNGVPPTKTARLLP